LPPPGVPAAASAIERPPMIRYILGRLGQSIVLLFVVSLIGYVLLQLAPGSPLAQFAFTPGMGQDELQRIAEQMGLDRPLFLQYFDWLGHLLTGNWGLSYRDGRPVLAIIGGHLLPTLLLMGSAMVIAVTFGIWLGIASAARRNSAFDYLSTTLAMIALSIPTFWFGLVAIYIFSVALGWFPAGNMYSVGDGSLLDILHHLAMPVLVLALVDVALWSRYMRSATLEVIEQDFVRTARAKGLADRIVIWRHAFKNTLVPLLTSVGIIFGGLLSNTFVVETIFNIPGLGRLAIDSIFARDYPVAMAIVLLFTAFFVLINLVVDILYAVIDPRIRSRVTAT
jgi:peptide/nickel transport system permease protein